jgi:hypothetical protein
VSGGGNIGASGVLWPLCVLGCTSVVVVWDVCVRDCRGLGLCKVGTVGWSEGKEYVGGSGSVVTGCGKIERGGEGIGRQWMRRSRKSSWEGEQWIVAQEKEGE